MQAWFKAVAVASAVVLPAAAHATQYLTIEAARAAVFPDASAFKEHPISITPQLEARIAARINAKVGSSGLRIWEARLGARRLGWTVLDRVIGKHDLITYMVALDPKGTVIRVDILEYRENYGGEVRNRRWLAQFIGMRANAPLRINREIQNISGATLSSRHLTSGVARILAIYEIALAND